MIFHHSPMCVGVLNVQLQHGSKKVDEPFDVIQAIIEWEQRNIPGLVSGCIVQRCLAPLEGGGLWWSVALGPLGRRKGIGYAPTLRGAFQQAHREWEAV